MNKKTTQPPIRYKSHYEETWTAQDYKDHEQEFQDLLDEYRQIRKECNDEPIVARREWLRRKKALRLIEKPRGGIEIIVNSKYAMYSAMFDRFTEWLVSKEKKFGSAELESLKKSAEELVDEITINDIPI
jgi:hypothetical protein